MVTSTITNFLLNSELVSLRIRDKGARRISWRECQSWITWEDCYVKASHFSEWMPASTEWRKAFVFPVLIFVMTYPEVLINLRALMQTSESPLLERGVWPTSVGGFDSEAFSKCTPKSVYHCEWMSLSTPVSNY